MPEKPGTLLFLIGTTELGVQGEITLTFRE